MAMSQMAGAHDDDPTIYQPAAILCTPCCTNMVSSHAVKSCCVCYAPRQVTSAPQVFQGMVLASACPSRTGAS